MDGSSGQVTNPKRGIKMKWFRWPERQIMYAGWLDGKSEDRRKWRQLGVEGRMIYNTDAHAFEHCDIRPERMRELLYQGAIPNPYSWTAYWVDTDRQLPRKHQLWGGAQVQL